MKLGSNVLGTKTKLLIEPIFDLGLRSENIEFVCRLKKSIFSLLRPKSKIGSIMKSFVLVPRTYLPSFKHISQKL